MIPSVTSQKAPWSRDDIREKIRRRPDQRHDHFFGLLPGLSRLIGYQDVDDEGNSIGISTVKKNMRDIWMHRGLQATKNTVPIMSTFAAAGQGKTELCLRLSVAVDLHEGLDSVNEVLAIPISFNQHTTYDPEKDANVEQALMDRILDCLLWDEHRVTDRYRIRSIYDELKDLFDDIRAALRGFVDPSLGILLCVDETLKVEGHQRLKMLELLSTFQQQSLRQGKPNFVLTTALHYDQGYEDFRRNFRRPLKLVNLPMVSHARLNDVATSIVNDLLAILQYDELWRERQCEYNQYLRRLTLWMVHMVGRHFRALENGVNRLFAIFVSCDLLKKYQQDNVREEERCVFGSDYFAAREEHYWKHQQTALTSGALQRTLFSSFLATVMTRGKEEALLAYCCELLGRFTRHCDLLDTTEDSDELFVEEDAQMICAETAGVAFIKARHPDRLSSVQPRVSLPFVFSAAKYMVSYTYARYGTAATEEGGELRQRSPQLLTDLGPLLLANIGLAIQGGLLLSNPPLAFQHLLLYVELYRVCLIRQRSDGDQHRESVTLVEVLPGAVVVGDADSTTTTNATSSSVEVNPSVWTTPVKVADVVEPRKKRCRGSDEEEEDGAGAGSDVAVSLINTACQQQQQRNCPVLSWTPSNGGRSNNAEVIAYAACHFSAYDEDSGAHGQLLWLASTQFRAAAASSLPALAEDVHRIARDACASNATSYYVVLYGCWPKAEIAIATLPPRTVVVPLETLRQMLRPFGGECCLEWLRVVKDTGVPS
eukprot:gene9329-6684_t